MMLLRLSHVSFCRTSFFEKIVTTKKVSAHNTKPRATNTIVEVMTQDLDDSIPDERTRLFLSGTDATSFSAPSDEFREESQEIVNKKNDGDLLLSMHSLRSLSSSGFSYSLFGEDFPSLLSSKKGVPEFTATTSHVRLYNVPLTISDYFCSQILEVSTTVTGIGSSSSNVAPLRMM